MILICKILHLFEKQVFLKFVYKIFHICLVTVHADLLKRISNYTIRSETSSSLTSKNFNVRISERKKFLTINDPLNKIDIHFLFIENIKVRKISFLFFSRLF